MTFPSLRGAADLLRSIADFIKGSGRAVGERTIFFPEEKAKRKAEALGTLAAALKTIAEVHAIEVKTLNDTVTMLQNAGVSQAKIQELVEKKVETLLDLSRPVEVLRRYMAEDKIIDFRMRDAMPPCPRSGALPPHPD